MKAESYAVYVRADEAGRITAINSSAFLADTAGWTQIDSGYGDKYHHAQGSYLPETLYDSRGVCRYRLEGGTAVERTQEEMDAEYAARPAPEPTDVELLLETAADHEYRICLMELGVSENDL